MGAGQDPVELEVDEVPHAVQEEPGRHQVPQWQEQERLRQAGQPSADWLPPKVSAVIPRASPVGQRSLSRAVQGRRTGVVLAMGRPALLGTAAEHDQEHEREHDQVLQHEQRVAIDDAQPQQRDERDGGANMAPVISRVLVQRWPRWRIQATIPADMVRAISRAVSSGERVG